MERFFVIQFLFFAVWAAALLFYPPLSGGALVPVPTASASGGPRPASPRPASLRPPATRPPIPPLRPGAVPPATPVPATPIPPATPIATAVPASPASPASPGATHALPTPQPTPEPSAGGDPLQLDPTPASAGKAGANGEWVEEATYARTVARDTNRPVLNFFTGSDWCGWCKLLDREVLSTPEFKQFASSRVVLLKLDFLRNSPQPEALVTANRALQQQYGVRGFPTIVVTDAAGTELGRTGYVRGGPAAFIAELEKHLPR